MWVEYPPFPPPPSLQLSDSEELQEQMFLLNRQLLLLGETNKLCMEEAQRVGPKSDKVTAD